MKIITSGILFVISLVIASSLYTYFTYKKTRSQYVWNVYTNWLFNTGNSIVRYYYNFITYLNTLFSNVEELEEA